MKVTEDSFSTENTDSVNNTLGYSKYGHYIVKKELEINLPNTAIKFSHHSKNKFSYHRTNSESEDVHKIIAVKSEPLQIELIPSLPLHLPAYKTDFVFLRFINKLFLSANSSTEVVVPFPIELAICITENNTTDYLDFFTCDGSNSRYGLYGSPEEGKLCKYARIPWEYNENVSYFRYAKMKITIHNELEKGTSLGRVVLPVTDHELYYRDFNARIDNLKVIMKNRSGLELAEIIQEKISKTEGWQSAPTDMQKTDYKFSMEKGFD